MINQRKYESQKKEINKEKKQILNNFNLKNILIIYIFLLLVKLKEVNLRYLQIYDSEISLLIDKTKGLIIFNSI